MCGVACRRFQNCDLPARFVPAYGNSDRKHREGTMGATEVTRTGTAYQAHQMEAAACRCMQGMEFSKGRDKRLIKERDFGRCQLSAYT